jgi:dCTP deaminase
MLSADEIAAALLLPPGDENRLSITPLPEMAEIRTRGGTSIDLRLGRWFRSFKQSQNSSVPLSVHHRNAKALLEVEASRTKQHFVPFGDQFVLHPGRFVLGVTLEWLRLPKNLSGYVTGKSSLGRHGLVIETAAGIHPLFSGCLTLELANVGEVPIEISPGMRICQIFLHRVTPAKTRSNTGEMSGQRKPSLPSPKPDSTFDKICTPE